MSRAKRSVSKLQIKSQATEIWRLVLALVLNWRLLKADPQLQTKTGELRRHMGGVTNPIDFISRPAEETRPGPYALRRWKITEPTYKQRIPQSDAPARLPQRTLPLEAMGSQAP